MPICQEHHERVAVAVAVMLDHLDQPIDLIGSQMLPRAQLRIWCAPRRDCANLVAGATSRRFGFAMIKVLAR